MKTRVMLVEDEPQVRAFTDEALHFLGFEVSVACDGAEALARLEETSVDVVFTDHRMPRMNGLELVRALRARGFAGRIFVASGVLTSRERADYEALRVDAVACKPLNMADLNRLLRGQARPRAAAATAAPRAAG